MHIQYNGNTLTLTADAHLDGGTIYLSDGGQYSGDWYQADATDPAGTGYLVYWFNPRMSEDGDESDTCDWSHPDYIVTSS
jgi:hypothetical protein